MYHDTNSMWETEAQIINIRAHQYFDHPFSVELSCSSLARGLKIIAVKVREEISTGARSVFSQLCGAVLKFTAVTSFPTDMHSGPGSHLVMLQLSAQHIHTGWLDGLSPSGNIF